MSTQSSQRQGAKHHTPATYDKAGKKWLGIEAQSIYKQAQLLTALFGMIQARMSKTHKYSLGSDMRRCITEVCKSLRRSWRLLNFPDAQLIELDRLISLCDEVVIVLQTADDQHVIARNYFADAICGAYKLLEQSIAWRTSVYSKVTGLNKDEIKNKLNKNTPIYHGHTARMS